MVPKSRFVVDLSATRLEILSYLSLERMSLVQTLI